MVARVVASRLDTADVDLIRFLTADVSDLDTGSTLAGIDEAAERLADAVRNRELIGIQTDYDMDGLGAHAVFRTVLTDLFQHPVDRLRSYVGHRLVDGYGLCFPVAQRIISDPLRPTLVVTADCGSRDEERIAQLRAAHVDVIVTDHHRIPRVGPPASAFACINPQRADCKYADKAIAGGMVLWLLLRETERRLARHGRAHGGVTTLVDVADYVMCSTVADCVSLASINNRAIVRRGLAQLAKRLRPCWQAMRHVIGTSGRVKAEHIAFGIAPRINARSRVADPFAALNFLLARDLHAANSWAAVLESDNDSRKEIEHAMMAISLDRAASQVEAGRASITLFLQAGHPGVQGICSSRLVERFGRPAILFSPSPSDPTLLVGSARSIDRVDVEAILQRLSDIRGDLVQGFGGHKAAAGVRVRERDFSAFEALFEQLVREVVSPGDLGPVRWSDGELAASDIHLAMVDAFDLLEPTGRGFEPPTFDGEFRVVQARVIGDGRHLRLSLARDGRKWSAVWFRARRTLDEPMPVVKGRCAHFLYRLTENTFRGDRELQLKIDELIDRD